MSDLNTAFVDGSAGNTPIDSTWLNAVNAALKRVPSGLASGFYYPTTPASSTSTSALFGNANLRVSPFVVPRPVTLTKIGIEITAVGDTGCVVRLGIYADNGSGYPGSLVLDAGTVPGDVVAVSEITINQPLSGGLYHVGACVQGVTTVQPTLRTLSGAIQPQMPLSSSLPTAGMAPSFGFAALSVAGALPTTFPATLNLSSLAARVFVKIQ